MGGSMVGSTLALKTKNKVSSWLKGSEESKTVTQVKPKAQSSWVHFREEFFREKFFLFVWCSLFISFLLNIA